MNGSKPDLITANHNINFDVITNHFLVSIIIWWIKFQIKSNKKDFKIENEKINNFNHLETIEMLAEVINQMIK